MMIQLRLVGLFMVLALAIGAEACAAELTPEQKQEVAELKQDLSRIRQEIEQAKKDDATYTGGLIKTLIGIRLEVLKTNEALVEQRIHALESRARMTIVVSSAKTDPARAAELAKEIESQKGKVAEARAEADRYAGGLVQALAETSVATARNTLAMLEQQYFIAKYGLAISTPPSETTRAAKDESKVATASGPTAPVHGATTSPRPADCLKIETFDSSVLSSNDVFTELAWKVDISNSCAEPFGVRVTFSIYDKDEFQLDSDSAKVYIPARGTGKARGKMLVSPPEKARRMVKQGASLSLR